MRKLFSVVTLAGLALAGGPVLSAEMRDEGPRAPCRQQAMQFDQALTKAMGGGAMSDKLSSATSMRNKGMEACQAGRVQEGRQQIQEATRALGA